MSASVPSRAAAAEGRGPAISIIIPTFNRAPMVCACVSALLASDFADFEIIVVDDCSPDDTGEQIAAKFAADPRVKYTRNDHNSFQAVSRNNGAKLATGRYLFFLDDDNVPASNMLSESLACFARHERVGLVAPLCIHQRAGKENLVWTLGSDFNRWTSQPKDYKANLPISELPEEPVDYPTTYSPNAFMVPRAVYDEVGGIWGPYTQIFEESDFGWLICEHGYSAWITTRAKTDHYGFLEPGCVPALRQLGIEKPYRTFCFARNRLRFARRHFSFLQILSVTFIFAPLSAVYYGWVAVKNHRFDIAWAYVKGTLCGICGM